MTGPALNARMRRIDLFCKLAGPLFIALIDGASIKIAIFVTFGINALSVPIEYFAIAQVRTIRSIPGVNRSITDWSRFTTLSPFSRVQKTYRLPLSKVRLSNRIHQDCHGLFHVGPILSTKSLNSTTCTGLSFRLLRSLCCTSRC